ncbi:MAG: glycoside hydrolase family 95 protein [Prevotella sp.]|nr:glycoside hydrolase family 95 protein [Prevotella sp.]
MLLWYDREAKYFEEALPIGNGQIGAVIYGGPDTDSLQLNDITLWTGKPWDRERDAEAYTWIPKIREALFNEDYQTADRLQRHVQGPDSEWYEPLGTLTIKDLHVKEGPATDYRRELDIDHAIARTSYSRNGIRYEREYLASCPDRLIAIRLKASEERRLAVALRLKSLLPYTLERRGSNQLLMHGHAIGDASETIHFTTLVQVDCGKQGLWGTDDEGNLIVSQATEATIYLTSETSFNGFDKHPVREGRDIKTAIDDDSKAWRGLKYAKVKARHTKDYQQLYARMQLFLEGSVADETRTTDRQLLQYTDNNERNPYLETLYAQYGRYLLISCSRTKDVPANLQGIWNPHLRAPWRSNYTININLEENYWPAEVANLTETTRPLIAFIGHLSENGRYAARNYYGIRQGWSASHNSDIWAMTNPVGNKEGDPVWANWNMGGAWLCMLLWEHYLYTQDEQFLAQTAYPLMKGAADFCLAWLIENPNRPEELITAPATSPENIYITDKGYRGQTLYGATADLAIIRELFANVAEAGKIMGVPAGETEPFQTALRRLHPYTVGQNGDLNEWFYDWEDLYPQHRHQSHLIGLYPGHHFTDPVLRKAAEQTLLDKGDNTTGWSTGWRINLWARLHNSRQAYHLYRKLLTYVTPDNYDGPDKRDSGGTYPNLFDAHSPFQIDGNFGGTAGVCEMLMQSSCEWTHDASASKPRQVARIELLPAQPKEWPSGSVKGLKARGAFTVDFTWRDGRVTEATLKPAKAQTLQLVCNGQSHTYDVRPNKTLTLHF